MGSSDDHLHLRPPEGAKECLQILLGHASALRAALHSELDSRFGEAHWSSQVRLKKKTFSFLETSAFFSFFNRFFFLSNQIFFFLSWN